MTRRRGAIAGQIAILVGVGAGCAHASGSSSSEPFVTSGVALRTRDGLSCRGYVVAERAPITDVFLAMGGTGTGTSAFIPEVMREVLEARSAALVTFDKPGVTATFGDPTSVRIDDRSFRQHTEGTLLECAHRALELATVRFGQGVRWHLRGHSEGALIALFLYDELLAANSKDARRVASLILSGLPLEPFAEIVRRQLADKPELARAVASCNWTVMRGLGVSCGYLRDAERRPSGRAMFEQLAARSPGARIVVFAGNADVNTPARFVHELEAWNAEHGHLQLDVRYYDGEHQGSPEARRTMTELLRVLVPKPE